MTLTNAAVLADIEHELGGPLEGIEALPVLNEAGRIICNARDWNFQVRPSALIAARAGDTTLPVPPFFKKAVSIQYTNGLTAAVVQTTLVSLGLYRSQYTYAPGYVLYVATSWKPDAAGVPQLQLEVWPPISATDAGLLTIYYVSNWPNIEADDEAAIPVPEFMEGIYRRVVRAVAAGYHNPQGGSISKRLEDIMAGPDWMGAVRADSEQLFEHGMLTNGSLSLSSGGEWANWSLSTPILPPAAR